VPLGYSKIGKEKGKTPSRRPILTTPIKSKGIIGY